MKKSSTRVGTLLCAAALVFSLSACGSDSKEGTTANPTTQSTTDTESPAATDTETPTEEPKEEPTAATSDAKADCDFLLGELNEITTQINSAMSEIQTGADHNAVLQPIVDRLNADVEKMTSAEVRAPLENFANEVEETFALIADLDYAAIQAGDADAVAKAQEVTPQILEKQEVLPEAGGKIDTVCKAVS